MFADFGFDSPGTWDGINFRQRIVDEAIRRNAEGFIIMLMWHAVRPTDDEPVTFKESVQGKLTDDEWQQLITPGTDLNERWKSQVDVIAWHLETIKVRKLSRSSGGPTTNERRLVLVGKKDGDKWL